MSTMVSHTPKGQLAWRVALVFRFAIGPSVNLNMDDAVVTADVVVEIRVKIGVVAAPPAGTCLPEGVLCECVVLSASWNGDQHGQQNGDYSA